MLDASINDKNLFILFICKSYWIFFLVNEGDTTFIVLEGSYKYHNDFTKEFEETSPDDWFLLNQEQIKWYIDAKKCIKKIIKCSAGSLVLRDS